MAFWADTGVLPRTGLALVWGPPKCGKSFWMLTVAMHIVMGREYRDRRVNKQEVVYLALEG
jgi:RecA-family ATPase